MRNLVIALLICNIFAWTYVYFIEHENIKGRIIKSDECNKIFEKIYKNIN
jgi:hypothetical protein